MLAFNERMLVRIVQHENVRSPQPRPLENGFSEGRVYRVLGIYSPSETSEAYFVLSNDREEVWFISNRHCRFAGLLGDGDAAEADDGEGTCRCSNDYAAARVG